MGTATRMTRARAATNNVFKGPNYMLSRTLTERVVKPGTKPNPDPHPPRGCPSNSLGPVWTNMYSDPPSTTTPAAVGIDSPDCVKWRETLPSQEESARRDIPMGQLYPSLFLFSRQKFKIGRVHSFIRKNFKGGALCPFLYRGPNLLKNNTDTYTDIRASTAL